MTSSECPFQRERRCLLPVKARGQLPDARQRDGGAMFCTSGARCGTSRPQASTWKRCRPERAARFARACEAGADGTVHWNVWKHRLLCARMRHAPLHWLPGAVSASFHSRVLSTDAALESAQV
jgi:hypothetical protein